MKQNLTGITELIGKDIVIGIDRNPIDDHLLNGFVVGVSEKCLLLHIVDGNTLLLGGYSTVRFADIRSYKVDETFVTRALRLLDRKPVIPEGVDLTNWVGLVASIKSQYALLLIEMEKKKPGVCFIGRVTKQTAQYIELETVGTEGKWAETERFAVKDITKIDFDNGYVNALSLLLASEGAIS